MRSSNCGANKTEWNHREDGQKGAFSQTSRRDSTETNKFSNGGERVGRDEAGVSRAFEERNTRHRVCLWMSRRRRRRRMDWESRSLTGRDEIRRSIVRTCFWHIPKAENLRGYRGERESFRRYSVSGAKSLLSVVVAKIITTVESVLYKDDVKRYTYCFEEVERQEVHVEKLIDVRRNETTWRVKEKILLENAIQHF